MINVLIKSSSRYPIRRKAIKETIQKTLESLQLFGDFEVEVEIIGDRMMKQVKKKHLGIDETTDVLSFPLEEIITRTQEHKNTENTASTKAQNQKNEMTNDKLKMSKKSPNTKYQIPNTLDSAQIPFVSHDHITRLGTILISYPQAQRQADLHKLTTDKEISQLVEHGMLHLVGIHHE